jgi:hydroxypyruvate isomerase
MVHTHGQRFDVNCSILFTALPLLKRTAAARSAGFDAVEFWWPFAEPVPPDHEVDRFVEAFGDASRPIRRTAPRASAGGDRSCRRAR